MLSIAHAHRRKRIVNYISDMIGTEYYPKALRFLTSLYKIPAFIINSAL